MIEIRRRAPGQRGVGVEDLQPAHQQDEKAGGIDPVADPNKRRMPDDKPAGRSVARGQRGRKRRQFQASKGSGFRRAGRGANSNTPESGQSFRDEDGFSFVVLFFWSNPETSSPALRNQSAPVVAGNSIGDEHERQDFPLRRGARRRRRFRGAVAAPFVAPAYAEMTKMVGGAPMYPSKNIIENAVNSKDHTTLVAAVKAAGLVDTLEGAGPFTVFAPTNEAFARLPAGTVETLLKPENKGMLTSILTYHVVPGRLTEAEIDAMIRDGGGKAMMKTVQGEELTFQRSGGTPLGDRRQGRQGRGHDPERDAVERRHPGDQQGAAPELSLPPTARKGSGGRAPLAPALFSRGVRQRRAGCAGRPRR